MSTPEHATSTTSAAKPVGSLAAAELPAQAKREPKSRQKPSLNDKFDLAHERVLLNGAQAVVRLTLMQRARDLAAGLNTAGYVTGYRGSPIAGLESQFKRAEKFTKPAQIAFHPGLNEDLAATALWGAQQAELRGEGKYDGVFGIWYGKGPGVDRTGDVFRHANHAGSSRHGGVLALMGDDHTCESSTSAHQSEFAFLDAMIPILNPAGVQEMLDYGVLGIAMSRFAGVWVGMKCVKDNIESTAVVDARAGRVDIKQPDDFNMPEGGLNIRLNDHALAKEARLHDHKRAAVLAFARANKLDQIIMAGGKAPRIGIISTGKSYLDVRQAFEELGIDDLRAADLGIRMMKVAMTWPLEPNGIIAFSKGLDLIIVVEEKRSLIETQIKEQLYNTPDTPIVVGKRDEHDGILFPAKGALEPTAIAVAIGERVLRHVDDEALKRRVGELQRLIGNMPQGSEIASRIPYFCSGCPHNSSTVVPEGSRAYAGIGCHFMAQWMDRNTEGFTQMGGEGANWIGEAPFSTRGHVFQNLGDGTYTHSGSLAIRAAVAAGTTMTYKILYNDAVAMTGGQPIDGGLKPDNIARQVAAEGVRRIAVVTDEPDKYSGTATFPMGTSISHRDELDAVQRELAQVQGVSVLIYDQTCAAEKRRRRKRNLYPDPPKRVLINAAVCEGCGDCGVQSNCVSIVPLETEFGRKRQIDQSSCNKDFSCVKGFCPSFVTVHGGQLRKPEGAAGNSEALAAIEHLPEPVLPALDRAYSLIVTGVGGTGVVTVSAVLAEAAAMEGKGLGSIDMAGLAQKGGAVACHMRIARTQEEIYAIRAHLGGADAIIGCDLVVTGSHKVLETMSRERTAVALNTYEMITGDFTRNRELRLPDARLKRAIAEHAAPGATSSINAHAIAQKLFGDTITSNMLMLGYAYQLGMVPVGATSIEAAIVLNGQAVEMNRRAFRFGRLAALDRPKLEQIAQITPAPESQPPLSLDALIARRKHFLGSYQDENYGEHYARRIAALAKLEAERTPGQSGLAEAAAHGLFKLMAYKDEYEVARLYTDGSFAKSLSEQFDGDFKLQFHLAPPLLAKLDPVSGRPEKKAYGAWMMRAFKLLAQMKGLRGTRYDPFGYSEERRTERRLISEYEAVLDDISSRLSPANHATALELAGLPREIRGFGPVKAQSIRQTKAREAELLAQFHSTAPGGATRKVAA